jgi:hypothetical protein
VPDNGIAGNLLYIEAYAGILAVETKNWRKLQLVEAVQGGRYMEGQGRI